MTTAIAIPFNDRLLLIGLDGLDDSIHGNVVGNKNMPLYFLGQRSPCASKCLHHPPDGTKSRQENNVRYVRNIKPFVCHRNGNKYAA